MRDLLAKAISFPSWDDAGSQPLEWGITLKDDWFALIIVSEGSQEGFLQESLDFLEACVGILIPGEAVLLFEEGPEGLSVRAEMRNEGLHIDGVESWSWRWWATWWLFCDWLHLLSCVRIWNDLTHLINGDHVSGVKVFNSIFNGLERSWFLVLILNGLKRSVILGSILNGLERTLFWYILRLNGLEGSGFGSFFVTFDRWSWKNTFTYFLVIGLERILIFWHFLPWFWKKLMNGLERTQILLLTLLHDILPSIFSWWSWKEFLELFSVFSIAKTDLEIFLHNTCMRPNLMLAGCPMMISFGVFVFTT